MRSIYADVSANYENKKIAGQLGCQVIFSGIGSMTLRHAGELFTIPAEYVENVREEDTPITKESISPINQESVETSTNTVCIVEDKKETLEEIIESVKTTQIEVERKLKYCANIFSEIINDINSILKDYEDKNSRG